MKKRKWTKAIPSLMLIAGVCSIMTIASTTGVVTGYATNIQDNLIERTVKENYVIGDTFFMPQAPMLSDGNKQYQSTPFLRDPNGKGYTQSEIVLDTAGVYTIEYKAITENGKLLKETQSFKCYSSLYNVEGKNAKVNYGKFEQYPDGIEGVTVSLTPSSVFSVNKIIDLSTMHNSYENNVEFMPLLSFYVAPQTLYTPDAKEIDIVLTDIYDIDNKVTIAIKQAEDVDVTAAWQYENVYLTASAEDQMKIGLEKRENGDFTWIDGKNYVVCKGTQYGASSPFSMQGGLESKGNLVEKQLLSIGWDYDEHRVYVQCQSNEKIVKSIVSDLDNELLYDNLFKGFTTGEVNMSITASGYTSTSCQMVITDIAGFDVDLLKHNYFEDVTGPDVKVDMLDYTSAPDAIVGKPYPVFNARYSDDYDANLTTSVDVYRGYNSNFPIKVSLIDGYFIPNSKGVYTVVYTAVDDAGNITKKIVEVLATEDIEETQITLSEKPDKGVVGQEVFVASAELAYGTGKQRLTVLAKHKNHSDIVYEINQETWSFRPLYAGEYNIVYRYGDYIEEKETSYVLFVEKDTTPYIPEELVLPEYVLKNSNLELPKQLGYIFNDGNAIETESEILVRQDYGDFILLHSNVIKVTAEEMLTIIYRLPAENSFYEVEYQIPVIDAGFGVADSLDLSKYFVGDCNADPQNTYILFTASGDEKDAAELKFVKSLLAEEFQIVFGTDKNYSGFEEIVITLTDSLDKNVGISLTVYPNEIGKTMVLVNNTGNPYTLGTNFFTDQDETNTFKYNNESRSVELISGELIVPIEKDLKGNDFKGFNSHFVNLKIKLNGIEKSVKDKAGIRIAKINNQFFSSIKNDIIEPEITTRTVREEKNLGETQELLPIYGADVLDPHIHFEMKVLDPDRQIVTAVDGTVLNNCDTFKTYTIKLEKYGTYSVEYYAIDDAGQQTYYSYVVKVVDKVAPEAVLSDLVEKGKVGDTIKLAKVTVTDNLDTELKITWFVKTPAGITLSLFENDVQYNAFVAKEKGVYTVSCYITDAAGNYTMKFYNITIS